MSTPDERNTRLKSTSPEKQTPLGGLPQPRRLYEITVPRDRGVVLGHGWADRQQDDTSPVHVAPDGIWTADKVPGLHWAMTYCPWCDARQTVSYDQVATVIVTWHADGCEWYLSVTDGKGGEAA